MSPDQLLIAFLEDEAKMPEAADGDEEPPAADDKKRKKRMKRANKLPDSLKGLPTTVREIIDPAVLADPEAFRLIGEKVSERLHVSPVSFTLEIIKRLSHARRAGPGALPVTIQASHIRAYRSATYQIQTPIGFFLVSLGNPIYYS